MWQLYAEKCKEPGLDAKYPECRLKPKITDSPSATGLSLKSRSLERRVTWVQSALREAHGRRSKNAPMHAARAATTRSRVARPPSRAGATGCRHLTCRCSQLIWWARDVCALAACGRRFVPTVRPVRVTPIRATYRGYFPGAVHRARHQSRDLLRRDPCTGA